MDNNDDRRPMLWASISPVFAFAVLAHMAHLFDRCHKRSFIWAQEITIALAMLTNVATIGLTIATTLDGFGTHMSAIPKSGDRITISLHAVWMVGGLTSGFARISIALVTLRCNSVGSRSKSLLLRVVVGLQALSTVWCEIVEGIWRRDIITSHPRVPAFVICSSCITALRTLGDLICAIIFIVGIRKLQRPRGERAVVISLTMLPLLAIACTGLKIHFLITYDPKSRDPMWELVPEYILWRVEETFLTFAACVPLLKSFFERVLVQFGLVESRSIAGQEVGYRLSTKGELSAESSTELKHVDGAWG